MNDETDTLHAGDIVTIECGEYSEHGVLTLVRALRDFAMEPTFLEWAKGDGARCFYAHASAHVVYHFTTHMTGSASAFVAWLVNRGDVEELTHRQWDLRDVSYEERR
jgi:hypothetical protein